MAKTRPSRKKRKWRTARCAASNSRSKALYLVSGGRSCRLKKARGCQRPSMRCSRTPPMALSDASTVSAVGASGRGCASMVASASACFVAVNALGISLVQTRCDCLDLPANVTKSGCMWWAAAGTKRWKKLPIPTNSWRPRTVFGCAKWRMTSTFSGSGIAPCWLMWWPRKSISEAPSTLRWVNYPAKLL